MEISGYVCSRTDRRPCVGIKSLRICKVRHPGRECATQSLDEIAYLYLFNIENNLLLEYFIFQC
jgi:hypothetical protein